MNITFLGGGDEIGASSAIVEIGSSRVLVDCGMRMSGDDVLPDLAAINRSGFSHLDAVIMTHAHMDHSGALPVLHQHFPHVPIYCTGPTRGLVEVLMRDSLNIMRHKAEGERELPLYARPAVESLLEKMIPVPFGSPTAIGNHGLTVTWFPAGHILGASSVGIETEAARTSRVLFSGDISVADQITVPGMLAPANFHPDVLVVESTYGDRLHSARNLEETRLLEMVGAIIERKGKLLIPAFAIGRAQEIILILLRQFRNKRLASFPVYIDGMVRSVCGVYSNFPAYQTPYCRRLIEHHGNPFFNVVDEIKAVTSPDEREKILTGPPCVIIASSGMLTGGASAFYAQSIVTEERNGLAITGYQDEESPGRALLDLAAGQSNQVNISGRSVEVKCSVAKYALSAHADANEIAGLVEAINPRQVVLVHGEGSARPALADLLQRSGSRNRPIHLPKTGSTINFDAVRRRGVKQVERFDGGLGGGQQLTVEALKTLAAHLLHEGEQPRPRSATELLDLWFGRQNWDEEQYTTLIGLLDPGDIFRRHPTRPHLYRVRRIEDEEESETVFFSSPEELIKKIDQAVGTESGLYHRGYNLAKHKLMLNFDFPLIARDKYREQIAQAISGSGWTCEIAKATNQMRLSEVARQVLPPEIFQTRPPALYVDRKEVVVTVGVNLSRELVESATASFKAMTGFTLIIKHPGMTGETSTANVPVYKPLDTEPVEINQAYKTIDGFFSCVVETSRPYRKSLKSDGGRQYIELAFITTEIGTRQNDKIGQLATEIGSPIRIKPEPNQVALVELVLQMIPPQWQLQKQPSIHKAENTIKIKCLTPPQPEDAPWINLCDQFMELTGWTIANGQS